MKLILDALNDFFSQVSTSSNIIILLLIGIFTRLILRLYKNNINIFVLYIFSVVLLLYIATFPFFTFTLNFKTLIYFSSMFIFFSFFAYLYIYTLRNLPKSISSFFLFSLNLLTGTSFIFGISCIFHGLSHAIYLEDLSQASYYRYCVYVFIVISCILLYFINFSSTNKTTSLYQNITYPYLKEEVRKILYSWNETFFGPLFTNLLDKLYNSSILQIILFGLHFIMCYLIKILQICFFLNFVFFHGDLRYVFFLLPFSFLSWIFDFFSYYFEVYVESSLHYVCEILYVTPIIPLTVDEYTAKHVLKTGNDFTFKITPFGYNEGFIEGANNSGLRSLANSWLKFQHLNIVIKKYKKFLYFFNIILLSLRILCWFGIIFFPFKASTDIFFTNIGSFFSRISIIRPRFIMRAPPSEAYSVRRQFQAQLEKETENSYKSGHPVVVDKAITDDTGRILYEHQPTHGNGPSDNPSKVIHPTTDLLGKPAIQSTVFPKTPTFIDPKYLSGYIPGSKEYLEDSVVRQNIAKPDDLNT